MCICGALIEGNIDRTLNLSEDFKIKREGRNFYLVYDNNIKDFSSSLRIYFCPFCGKKLKVPERYSVEDEGVIYDSACGKEMTVDEIAYTLNDYERLQNFVRKHKDVLDLTDL